ncbi:unnamed protein product [Blepharisma stoltei]|uniref:Uncharacterized protein n=1 Tax=Blepharisma stoltei TaxID=1481888 RepID=A0AAU9IQG6_9CILI|nr:unnamed protein product [Blepharisma stoltei]
MLDNIIKDMQQHPEGQRMLVIGAKHAKTRARTLDSRGATITLTEPYPSEHRLGKKEKAYYLLLSENWEKVKHRWRTY